MDYTKEKIEHLEYYMSLLLTIVDKNKCPFFFFVMNNKLTKADVEKLLGTCESLSEKLIAEQKEGMVHFDYIFAEFVATLPTDVNVDETIKALAGQGLYPILMNELKKYI